MVLTNFRNISLRSLASISISSWKFPNVCPIPHHRQWCFLDLTTEDDSSNEVPDCGIKRRRGELDDLTAEKLRLSKMAKYAPSFLSKPFAFQTLAQDVVACNRPFDSDTIPITLLQEEFGLFMDDCKVLPSPKSQELLQALTVAACKWYESETQRRSEIQKVFDDVAGFYLSAEIIAGTEYKTDGNSRVNIMPAVIRKCNNEAGCTLQEATAYYVQFLVKVLDRRDMGNRFPCILLIDTGKVVYCITTQRLMLRNRNVFWALRLPMDWRTFTC